MPSAAPKIPADGQPIQHKNARLEVPDRPIIPFIEGDGTGADIWRASQRVLDAAVAKAYGGKKKIAWVEVYAGEKSKNLFDNWLPDETVEAFRKYLVGIKGPLTTPVGGGIRSLNVALRQMLDLFVCLRPVRWFKGVPSPVKRPEKVDMVIFRENTEDIYAGIEYAAGTPEAQKVLDFYDQYRSEGGGATGGHGCSTGAGAWIAGLGLAVALLARRRSKARGAAGLLVLVGLLAPGAEAARYDPPPRKLLFAVKIDKYDPNVDSEPGLTGQPYHEIFGTRVPLRVQLEADWEVAHPFGSVLIGATVGYWQNYGKGLLVDRVTRSDDTVLLDVIPFGLIATYRFDWLADRLPRFPFIPYAQVGLQNALWASFNGTGGVSKPDQGGRGSGWTYGYTTALGIALNLNAIDPELAREAYVDTGIQRSSLFVEYGWTRLDNFGRAGALHLSDRAWRFGFALEF